VDLCFLNLSASASIGDPGIFSLDAASALGKAKNLSLPVHGNIKSAMHKQCAWLTDCINNLLCLF